MDESNFPTHIAIIMDGNRRWARQRGLPDKKGHEAGAQTLVKIVEASATLGIKTLTVYALSTENIEQRSKREVMALFSLIQNVYRTQIKKMQKEGVNVTIIGELTGLPDSIKVLARKLKKTYIQNESVKLNIALNYGGRKELVEAIKEMLKNGIEVEKLDEALVAKHLYTKNQTDPQLVIRTGGYFRLSNFLLWQTAYSEFYFSSKLWPDFTRKDLEDAIDWYKAQKRNFGK